VKSPDSNRSILLWKVCYIKAIEFPSVGRFLDIRAAEIWWMTLTQITILILTSPDLFWLLIHRESANYCVICIFHAICEASPLLISTLPTFSSFTRQTSLVLVGKYLYNFLNRFTNNCSFFKKRPDLAQCIWLCINNISYLVGFFLSTCACWSDQTTVTLAIYIRLVDQVKNVHVL
jgi:hypothetical protein